MSYGIAERDMSLVQIIGEGRLIGRRNLEKDRSDEDLCGKKWKEVQTLLGDSFCIVFKYDQYS